MSLRVARVTVDAPHGSDTVATATPAIGWVSESDARGWMQSGAELELELDGETQMHRVGGRDSVRLRWPFRPLQPRDEATLRVRVTGSDGAVSPWSEPRRIVAGFLADGEWTARTIAVAAPTTYAEPATLRTTFSVDGEVRRATLYATAVGVYQAAFNGEEVDDQVLKPGWTPFHTRTVHESTDVTALVRSGENAVTVRLAGAWATEHYGFRENAAPVYEEQPRFAAQLLIEYADGRVQTVRTDESWQSAPNEVTASGLYAGEDHDARRGTSDWSPVAVVADVPVPGARVSPFVRRIEELPVAEVITTPSGRTVLDFGQNLVGRLRIRVQGASGTVVTLRHAEVLEHGELGTRPLRAAAATDRYTLAGDGVEVWEPEFTFHGFRYAEIDGWPGVLDPADISAVVIHSDMERTGWFDTSHELVRQLHQNVVWGLRGNFLSVPTDCPQRDERLGWTGDIQVFAPTASFLYDVRGFLDSWLRDLEIDQVDGVVPFVVPNVLGPARAAAAWGDAAAVVPTVLYERFADLDTLERQFDSMRAWTDVIVGYSGDRRLWEGMFQFGDWLDPDAPPQHPAKAKTSADIVATAYVFRSADLTARAAALLGRESEAREYAGIAEEVRRAFVAEYVTESGRMVSDAQTAYSLAIVFDMVDESRRQALGDRLAELTRLGGYRIGTGFVGTPIIQDALTRTGHLDTATRLLTQTENPSWLYPVTMGATTIWERWDSMLPDGTINPGQMTSFNHYALGAIADWLHRTVAGLAPATPGYARIAIEPHPLEGFDDAEASHLTPYGEARVRWQRSGESIIVEATVPANTDADVVLPDGRRHTVGSGSHRWTSAALAPRPEPGEVGPESTLAQIIDDSEAYQAIVEVLGELRPAIAEDFRDNTEWSPRLTLGELFARLLGPEPRAAVERRLTALNTARS
ncbi:family 78 glycoside hydrolase catalytic domain [Microbacterium sp. C5A9]|uniref:alpha-L-rhamnosidase n=1 Tax=Microbacterium sp. C5A9 TaxID=2736663 RepID=UPI001F5228F1|nr:alpha-L-rhamnosidase [Microbacterium sp. C5A9]MCI1017138.1 family 78 glycoside hydrolase catalytic domain [Microbacterium sp. C5A9]